MKEITMVLDKVPKNHYAVYLEQIYVISPGKVYMVRQQDITSKTSNMVKYLFRLPTKDKMYETLITQQLYDGILVDELYEEIKLQNVYEYLYGKNTIRVYNEVNIYDLKDKEIIYAVGPADDKEWQYEFQKYRNQKG